MIDWATVAVVVGALAGGFWALGKALDGIIERLKRIEADTSETKTEVSIMKDTINLRSAPTQNRPGPTVSPAPPPT